MEKQEFFKKWNSHIQELNGLRWNLNQKDRDKLTVIQSELNELAEKAAENREAKQLSG